MIEIGLIVGASLLAFAALSLLCAVFPDKPGDDNDEVKPQ
jgi:hypothetical protein